MKMRKIGIALTSVLLALCVAFSLFTFLMGTSKAEAETTDYTMVYDEGGAFKGINAKYDVKDGVYIGVKKDQNKSSWYTRFTIDFGQDVTVGDSTGFFVQLNSTSANSVDIALKDSEGKYWRTWTASKTVRADSFTLADGTVSAMNMSSNKSLFVKNQTGTLYIPWAKVIGWLDSDGTTSLGGCAMPATTKIRSVSFYVTLVDKDSSGKVYYYNGQGITVYSAGVVKVNGNNDAVATTYVDCSNFTYATTATDTTADVNSLAPALGKTIRADGGCAFQTAVYEVGTKNGDFLAGYCEIKAPNKNLTVKYVDDKGATIKSDEVKSIAFAGTEGYKYTVEPAEISGYEYGSADKDLTGAITGDDTITLTYNALAHDPLSLTVKYVDENGETIKDDFVMAVPYDETDGYKYTITPVTLYGYEYKSADKALEGTLAENGTITLTYKYTRVITPVAYDMVYDEGGAFKGINAKADTDNGVYIGVKKDQKKSSWYTRFTIDFGQDVTVGDSTGFFVQLNSTTANSVDIALKDSEGNYWRTWTASTTARADSFTLADGTVSAMNMSSNKSLFVKGQVGTLYIPWKNVIGWLDKDGATLSGAIPTTTKIRSVSFYITLLDINSSGKVYYYNGQGITVYSAGVVKVNGNNDAVATTYVNCSDLTYATTSTDTTADVNSLNATLGNIIRADGGCAFQSEVYGLGTKNGDFLAGYCEIKLPTRTLTVKYVDEDGVTIKEDGIVTVNIDLTENTYNYSISAPIIVDYEYVSADKDLEGTITENETVTLTYKKVEKEIEWDENPTDYTATFDDQGNLTSFLYKANMEKAIYAGLKADMVASEPKGILSVFSIALDEGMDTTASTGMFIHFKGPRDNYGFNMFVKDGDGNYYKAYTNCANKDLFTALDGTVKTLTTSNTQHMFTAKEGTWFIPWEFFSDMSGKAMGNVTIVEVSLSMNNQKTVWFAGYGVKISTIGTLLVGEGKTKMEVVVKADDFTYTNDANDTTKDVNLADVTKGAKFYSRVAYYGGEFHTAGNENYDSTIGNVEFKRVPVSFTIKCVDGEGTEVETFKGMADYNVTTGKYDYTITPPTVFDYEYVSCEDGLTGTLDGAGEVVTLVYKLSDNPTAWDTDPETYEVMFDDDGNLSYFMVNSDITKAAYIGVRKGIIPTEDTNILLMASFGFGEGVKVSESTGMFVKFTSAKANMGFTFVIRDSEGNMYSTHKSFAGKDMFTTEYEDVISLMPEGSMKFVAETGTWFIPWEYFTVLGKGTDSPLPSDAVIVDGGFGLNLKQTTWFGGTGMKISSAGTLLVHGNKTKINIVFDAANLTYSTDPECTTADVNCAAANLGKYIFCKYALDMSGWKYYDINDETYGLKAINDCEISRPKITFTVNYIDEEMRVLRDFEEISVVLGDPFEITPATFLGYKYKESNLPLSGTATEELVFNLVYEKEVYKLTIKYVDANGKTITADDVVDYYYKDLYEIEPKNVSGYNYVEASRNLKGTIMGDTTITLTYFKEGKTCSNVTLLSALTVFTTIITTAFIIRKKR